MKDSPFVIDKLMISVATVYNVLQKLKRPETTFTYVTKKYNLSLSGGKRYLIDYLQDSTGKTPECKICDF